MNNPNYTESENVDSLIGINVLNNEEIREMVAREAYRLAEQRGFKDGNPEDDWLEAERTVMAMLYINV